MPQSMWDLSPLTRGLNACPLHWKGGVLTAELRGKSHMCIYTVQKKETFDE